jgi:hypothetical protein
MSDNPGLRGIVNRRAAAFVCLIVGDERLPMSYYRVFAARFDRLLSERLPDVAIDVYGGLPEDHSVLARYCRERRIRWCTTTLRPPSMVRSSKADAVVVFDAADELSAEVVRQAKERGVALRVVDVRRLMPR